MSNYTMTEKGKQKRPEELARQISSGSAGLSALAAVMGNQAALSMPDFQSGGAWDARTQTSYADGGQPLSDAMRTQFEQQFGLPMGDVRIHYDSDEPAKLGALAYAMGTDVFIGPGQERHLKHELGHVVQQKFGLVEPTTTIDGLPVNLDQELERRADTLSIDGEQAVQKDSVVQMELPQMNHQMGADCGFSALARAISKLLSDSDEIDNSTKALDERSGLEKELADYAVVNNLSTLGEAFNPETLVSVCNGVFHDRLEAETLQFQDITALQELVENARTGNGVILFPYFPDDDWRPVAAAEENAHWAAFDPADIQGETITNESSIPIYEGNSCGIHTGNIYNDKGPLYTPLETLLNSNLSLKETFDWNNFIKSNDIRDLRDYCDQFLPSEKKLGSSNDNLEDKITNHIKASLLAKKEKLYPPEDGMQTAGEGELTERVELKGSLIVIRKM